MSFRSGRVAVLIALVVIATFTFTPKSHAHADLDEQIARITAKLSDQSDKTGLLYLQRADLYRRHGQYDEALLDIAEAARLKPDLSRIKLERAKVFNDSGRPAEAIDAVQQFLAVETNHWDGLIIRARAYQKLNQLHDALPDYTAAIAKAPSPGPDLFLERASIHAGFTNLDAAIRGLDEGIARAGALPVLELRAIAYERRRNTFDAAIARVDQITARYPVKEPSLALRAEILEQAGRQNEARETFTKVLAGIETYPSFRRTLELTKQLEARARAGLARLETKLSPNSNSSWANLHSALQSTP